MAKIFNKKNLIPIIILGIILIGVGLFVNPTSYYGLEINNKILWKISRFHILQYYVVSVGIVLILNSLITIFIKENFYSYIIPFWAFGFGLIFIVLGNLVSPDYALENFSRIGFLSKDALGRILTYQLISIILGTLLLLMGSIYALKSNSRVTLKVILLVLVSGFILFLAQYYNVYISYKYPSNILFKFSSVDKVKRLLLGQDILLTEYDPINTLKVNNKNIVKAKYPVIDINFHMKSNYKTKEDKNFLSPEKLVKSMDSVGLAILVNTDGFRAKIDDYLDKYPSRFIMFDPTGFPPSIVDDEFFKNLPKNLEEKVKRGAKGDGEIWKHLGLRTRDKTGKVIHVDDQRLDPFWEKAGELGIPILWHMVDVPANFQPIDKHNERFEMLSTYPEFSHYNPGIIPPREVPLKDRENVLRKHPNTIFIGCHMGMNANDLEYVGYLLDTFPNYYVEISTVLSELGRQPYTARKFFIKYQDRIMFGTDGGSLFGVDGWTVEKFYQAHWEFLETDNEYIKYPMQGAINQGSWRIYGLSLPDSVLEKIYYKNAAKILNLDLVQFENLFINE